jgi:dihydroneopterin aldolase
LEDTICYGAISEKILKICNLREYRLLEKLGWDVYSALRESLPKTIQLSVQATKEKTPIKALQDGAKFSITDGYTQSDVENP